MALPKALVIDGLEIPVAYDSYTITRNKIHSANTGRTNSGKMVGTIIAIKDKIEVTLIPLNPTQAQAIDRYVSNTDKMFQKVKALYVNGAEKEMTVYFGDVSYHYMSSTVNGGMITGVSVHLIEQ